MYPEHVVYVSFMYLDFVSFGVISAINEHSAETIVICCVLP